jgi:hypothetical protein
MQSSAALAVAALLLSGCERSAARDAFDCSCSYLTDTDVPGEQSTPVCVERGKRAESTASDCVAGMGVGQVEKCTCTRAERVCSAGACEP